MGGQGGGPGGYFLHQLSGNELDGTSKTGYLYKKSDSEWDKKIGHLYKNSDSEWDKEMGHLYKNSDSEIRR